MEESVSSMCCFSGLGGMAGVGRFALVVGRAMSKGESSMRFGCGVFGFGGCGTGCWGGMYGCCCCGGIGCLCAW